MSNWRARRAGCLLAVAALVGGVASPAHGSPTPSPTITWPAPGAKAQTAPALSIGGAALTVRPLRNPLVLLDENVEKGTARSFTLGADVLFDTGKDTLTPAAGTALGTLASTISKEGITGAASVAGNTDDVGTPASNLDLSKRRANAVTTRLQELLAGRNITLTAVGKGETDPLVPNTSDASRARNRRVSVIFSGTQRDVDRTDVSVPATQPAPAADPVQGPSDSLIGTERTLTVNRSDPQTWRIRVDVTGVRPVGPNLIAVELETRVISGPAGSNFTEYSAIFSGSTWNSTARQSAIYDRSASQLLPVVIDGKGAPLASTTTATFAIGQTTSDWKLFPRPQDMSTGQIELYVPALGVLTIPVKA